jgi:glycyl-tRNA synthetase
VDRTALALLVDAYDEEPDKEGIRVVLRFKFSMAPVQVAVLPLSRKENLGKLAQQVYSLLRKSFRCQFDDAQSIGRRYRRQDEIGTPLCATVDFQSLEDNMVTLRHRDSMEQIRVPIATLSPTVSAKLEGEVFFTLPPGGQVWLTQQPGKE